jgi:hypothetical protein
MVVAFFGRLSAGSPFALSAFPCSVSTDARSIGFDLACIIVLASLYSSRETLMVWTPLTWDAVFKLQSFFFELPRTHAPCGSFVQHVQARASMSRSAGPLKLHSFPYLPFVMFQNCQSPDAAHLHGSRLSWPCYPHHILLFILSTRHYRHDYFGFVARDGAYDALLAQSHVAPRPSRIQDDGTYQIAPLVHWNCEGQGSQAKQSIAHELSVHHHCISSYHPPSIRRN